MDLLGTSTADPRDLTPLDDSQPGRMCHRLKRAVRAFLQFEKVTAPINKAILWRLASPEEQKTANIHLDKCKVLLHRA
jgi:hypothetical protein